MKGDHFIMAQPSAPPMSSTHYDHWNLHPGSWKDQGNGSHVQHYEEQGKTCTSDFIDNEPEPSAPPVELLDKVAGYEYASFNKVDIPPPCLPKLEASEAELQRSPLPSQPRLSEKDVRQALVKYASQRCCYGKSTALNMSITKLDHSCAFHYTLESFTEKRQTSWAFEPYTGGPISCVSTGVAPLPWSMPTPPPAMFQNSSTQIEVPHTATIKTCHICGGVGRKRCFNCSGNGWEYCHSCRGDGEKGTLRGESERCFQCLGTGRRRCWKCNGNGLSLCKGCTGTGQIKCYISLNVIWTNHVDDHVVDRACIPDEKLKSVSGQTVLSEEHQKLSPVDHFPDTTINMASLQLIQKHASEFTAEKLIMQRHEVRIIPVTTACYQWRNFEGSFSVFGFEQKVYAPHYPQTCCCGCTIL